MVRWRGLAVCAVFFVLCLLISRVPLQLAQGVVKAEISPARPLDLLVLWQDPKLEYVYDAQWSRDMVLFLVLVLLAFLVYMVALCLPGRQPEEGNYWPVYCLTWLVTIGVGIVFVLTPAMLSHDIFSYAGYGRLQVIYHANPYFTPLAAFPHDSFRAINDWPGVPSAYGPIWQMICGALVPVIGDSPSRAIIVYRSVALVAHLLNVVLIMCILQALGRSSRTVASGMLLYAWNPLVLEESVMGGHNDVLMMTLILLGLLFSVRNVERGGRLPL
ncbi:MAG: hypothetical protein J2P37_13030, partial [Ktedonobacteraceae bacterium]|nr:hypothetical protein [Ktedonobacteraceae bacterium]